MNKEAFPLFAQTVIVKTFCLVQDSPFVPILFAAVLEKPLTEETLLFHRYIVQTVCWVMRYV